MRFGLSLKLGTLLAIFGVLSTALTAHYSYRSSRAMLVKAAEQDLLTATQVLARRFSVALAEVERSALLLAEQTDSATVAEAPAGPGAEGRKAALARMFTALLDVHPEYFQVRLIAADNHGIELVRVDRDGDRLTRVAAEHLQEKGHYPYVFEAIGLQRGQVYHSKIAVNHERGAHSGWERPTLQVATPVFSGVRARGLIVINIDLNGLFDLLKADLPASYALYLTNNEGDYLIHPDPARTFGFDRGRRALLQNDIPETAALLTGDIASLVVSNDAAGAMTAFHKQAFPGTGGERFVAVGLAKPLDDVLQDSRRLGDDMVRLVAGASLLALILSLVVAQISTRPMTLMTRAVRRFSRDRGMVRLPVERRDEIGDLARAFHEMQIEIRAHLDEVYASKAQLDHLARHDPLTGLPNRMMCFDRLEMAIAASRRSGRPIGVFFIDLDLFKEINDGYGHATGDEVLRHVAQRLRATVRDVDTVARLGGDEFVVIVGDLADIDNMPAIGSKLVEELTAPLHLGNRLFHVGASIGASVFPRDGDDASELLQKADTAMYRSKVGGRNRVTFYRPEPPPAD